MPGSLGAGGSSKPEGPQRYDKFSALVIDPGFVLGVEAHQNVCSALQINDIFTACLGATATQSTCEGFVDAAPENQGCYECTFGTTAPTPMPVVFGGNLSPFLMSYACMAHVANLPQCEVPVQSLIFCGFTACEQCDSSTDEWIECVNWAINDPDICGVIEVADDCIPLFRATEFPAECGGNATPVPTALGESFPALASYYCGAP